MTTSLPAAAVEIPYTATLTATGGTGNYTNWTVTVGALPGGLSLTGGVLNGKPTAAGTSTFTVQVTDSNSNVGSVSLSITVSWPAPPPPGTTTITGYNNSTGATVVGLTITVDGNSCQTPCYLIDGLSHSVSMPSPETGPSGNGSQAIFTAWSDAGGNPHTIQAGATVAVDFTTYYQFTGSAVFNGNSSGGGAVVAATLNSQGVAVPSSSPPSGCIANSSGWLCPAGTSFWVTGQANSGVEFITLDNGFRQQSIAMNFPVTVVAYFTNSIFTATTSPMPTMIRGRGTTAHYTMSAESSSGVPWSGPSTIGSFDCYSLTNQILAAIGNISASAGDISFDGWFLSGGSAAPGESDMTCSCNYFECIIDMGPVGVTAPTTPTVTLTPAYSVITLTPLQTDPIQVTLDGAGGTLTLAVSPANAASLDSTVLNLTSGQSATVTLSPLSASQSMNDVQVTATYQDGQVATASLTIAGVSVSRPSLIEVTGVGSPAGGTFSYSTNWVTGNTSVAPVVAASQSNPTDVNIQNPTNPCQGAVPCQGSLSEVNLTYSLPPGNDYMLPVGVSAGPYVATFGTSCYNSALQTDWGAAPNSCLSTTIPGQGTYSGAATSTSPIPVLSWLPPGNYCEAFLKTFSIEGSAQLADGSLWLWSATNHNMTQIGFRGTDGTLVQAGKTVARDPNVIPTGGVTVDMNGIADGLLANDGGGWIQGYRIDRYMGLGVSACSGANANNVMSVSGCNPGNLSCPAGSATGRQ